MENTVVLGTPRSGSNFLINSLSDISNLYKSGEFFSGGNNCYLYCLEHLKYISWYHFHKYQIDYALKIYQKMFQIMGRGSDNGKNQYYNRNAINPEHLALLLNFIKDHPQTAWSYTLQKNIRQDRLCVKIFYNHYDYENHFDVREALEMFDNLILIYRENMLNQFISFRIASKTQDWYLSCHENRTNSLVKITWNLNDYLWHTKETIAWTKEYKKHLSDFRHKKTAIIKYEDINTSNYKQEIEKILESNGIEHKIGYSGSRKQSIESIDIADKFINKEQFLDEYSQIQDKILLKLEDL